jgi:Pretoxin HINT domain
MQTASGQIAVQEADYQRSQRESQTSLLDILLQVGVGMLLDMIGYTSLVGCLGGSIWDCVDLATNFLGPLKALKMAKSLYQAADRAFSAYRLWKRIVDGAMRRSQDLLNVARKHLGDIMKKVPKRPKPPKKKVKPPAKKKQKPKEKAERKPAPSKAAKKEQPKTEPKQEKKRDTKPAKAEPKEAKSAPERDREPRKQDDAPEETGTPSCPTHSFDPATRVLMADGSTRPISEVTVGDEVQAKDPVTGEAGARQVTQLHSNRDLELTDVTVSNVPPADDEAKVVAEGRGGRSTRGPTESVLQTTAHHPFWDATTGEWTDAAELIPNRSTLITPDGQVQYVTAVDYHVTEKVMRDLTVDDIHTHYVVAGNEPVLVHNNDDGCYATFHSVQNTADADRLRNGGEPWPDAETRAAWGQGVYAWDNLDSAKPIWKA